MRIWLGGALEIWFSVGSNKHRINIVRLSISKMGSGNQPLTVPYTFPRPKPSSRCLIFVLGSREAQPWFLRKNRLTRPLLSQIHRSSSLFLVTRSVAVTPHPVAKARARAVVVGPVQNAQQMHCTSWFIGRAAHCGVREQFQHRPHRSTWASPPPWPSRTVALAPLMTAWWM